jgi:hypothetical protein
MLIIHNVNASVQQDVNTDVEYPRCQYFVQHDVNTDVDYPRCEYFCTAGCEY